MTQATPKPTPPRSPRRGRGRITPGIIQKLKAFAEQSLAQEGTPGMVLALTDREGLLWEGAFGFRNLDARIPMRTDTLLETGSTGKSYTAAITMQLVEEGLLDLHAPITDYLPWFEVQTEYAPITIHHLLTHTSGLIGGTDWTPDPRLEVYSLRETVTGSAPGTIFNYSNVGYKTLGLILEQVTGQSYAQLVRERILARLGVSNTTPVITHAWRARMAEPYQPLFDDRPTPQGSGARLVTAPWFQTNTADGCIAATAADLAAWLRALMNRGEAPHGRIVSDAAFQQMITPAASRNLRGIPGSYEEQDPNYGYGLTIQEKDDTAILSHGGGMVGYFTNMIADLDAGLGATGIINGPGNVGAVTEYGLALLQANMHSRPLPEPPPVRAGRSAEDAQKLAGTYANDSGTTLQITAGGEDGSDLTLDVDGEQQTLQSSWSGLVVGAPLDPRHALEPQRNDAGEVIALAHGGDWYAREGAEQPAVQDAPAEWQAYVGFYKSHNPWRAQFNISLRRGRLTMDGYGELHPLANDPNTFRIGKDERNPDRLRFHAIVDGKALGANMNGEVFARFFAGEADLADIYEQADASR